MTKNYSDSGSERHLRLLGCPTHDWQDLGELGVPPRGLCELCCKAMDWTCWRRWEEPPKGYHSQECWSGPLLGQRENKYETKEHCSSFSIIWTFVGGCVFGVNHPPTVSQGSEVTSQAGFQGSEEEGGGSDEWPNMSTRSNIADYKGYIQILTIKNFTMCFQFVWLSVWVSKKVPTVLNKYLSDKFNSYIFQLHQRIVLLNAYRTLSYF